MNVTGTEQIAAFILAIFLFLIMVSAVSYTMSIFAVGETLMFIILKNRTDNDNILEKNDEDDVDDEDSDSEITNDEFVQENDEDMDSDDKGNKD